MLDSKPLRHRYLGAAAVFCLSAKLLTVPIQYNARWYRHTVVQRDIIYYRSAVHHGSLSHNTVLLRYITVHYRTLRCSPLHRNPLSHNTVLLRYIAIHYRILRCSPLHRNPLSHNTVLPQYITVHYRTLRRSPLYRLSL